MQDEQAHPAEHPLVDPLDDLVGHAGVGGVAPPGQHVGLVEDLRRQSVLRLVLGGRTDLDVTSQRGAEAGGDGAVHPVGIALGHLGAVAVGVLVEVLAPDGDANR